MSRLDLRTMEGFLIDIHGRKVNDEQLSNSCTILLPTLRAPTEAKTEAKTEFTDHRKRRV